MQGLVVTVWLTTLCIDGYLAVVNPPVSTPALKGQNLTLTCRGCPTCTCSWHTYTYQNGVVTNINALGISTCTYTILNISEKNLNDAYECSSNTWVIVPIHVSKFFLCYFLKFNISHSPTDVIYNKPAINPQMDGSYTCSTNGTGFGQLVLDWTVNGMPVTSGATITYTNQTNGATVSAMSTLNVKQVVMTVFCTAYFDTNMTNSSTSNQTTQRKSRIRG